jgi:hypothetical protein
MFAPPDGLPPRERAPAGVGGALLGTYPVEKYRKE